MVDTLSRYWWVMALRGVAALVFGVLAFVWPALTLTALVLLFGAYALVDGVFSIVAGVMARRRAQRWWLMLVSGVAGTVLGVLTLLWPGTTALVLVYWIAAWSLVTGVLQLAAAIRLRKEIEGEWLLALAGIVAVVFGVVLVVAPGAGALALVWIIATYAVLVGILLLVLAFRLRGLRSQLGARAPGARSPAR